MPQRVAGVGPCLRSATPLRRVFLQSCLCLISSSKGVSHGNRIVFRRRLDRIAAGRHGLARAARRGVFFLFSPPGTGSLAPARSRQKPYRACCARQPRGPWHASCACPGTHHRCSATALCHSHAAACPGGMAPSPQPHRITGACIACGSCAGHAVLGLRRPHGDFRAHGRCLRRVGPPRGFGNGHPSTGLEGRNPRVTTAML